MLRIPASRLVAGGVWSACGIFFIILLVLILLLIFSARWVFRDLAGTFRGSVVQLKFSLMLGVGPKYYQFPVIQRSKQVEVQASVAKGVPRH